MLAAPNSSHFRAPFAGASNARRYHPIPRLYGFVMSVPAASFAFQVCGRSTDCQPAPVASSAAASVSLSSWTNFQPLSSGVVVRRSGAAGAAGAPAAEAASARTRPDSTAFHALVVMFCPLQKQAELAHAGSGLEARRDGAGRSIRTNIARTNPLRTTPHMVSVVAAYLSCGRGGAVKDRRRAASR